MNRPRMILSQTTHERKLQNNGLSNAHHVRPRLAAALVAFLCVAQTGPGQQGTRAALKAAAATALTQPPRAWAQEAANNELSAIQYNGIYLRYRIHSVGAKGNLVRDIVESKDGSVARLIYKEGRALTADEDQAEQQRLKGMLESPSDFARHVKNDQTGKKLATDLIKLMPDAMLFSYVAGQPQRDRTDARANEVPEVVLDFKPNPDWVAPTMTSQALSGLQGRMWINAQTKHIARFDANIFRPVNFGWGMVAHVNPGGAFSVEQVDLNNQRWIFSHFVEHVTLRALMVKTVKEDAEIDASRFMRIEPMSYQQGIHMLLDTPLPKSL